MYAAAYRGVNFGIECVKLLLQAGASVNKLNNKKHNALFTHIFNFSHNITHTIPDKTMVLLLFAAGEEIHMETIKKLFNEVYDKSKVKSVLNYVIPSLPKLCLQRSCAEADANRASGPEPVHQHYSPPYPSIHGALPATRHVSQSEEVLNDY